MDKHIEDLKQYDTENRLEEIMSTNHYGVHVHAMTKEALHSKSAIAVELAWRDLQISTLLVKLKAAESKVNHYVAAEYSRNTFDQTADIIKRADEAERKLEAAEEETHSLRMYLSDVSCLLAEWKQRVEKAEQRAEAAEARLLVSDEWNDLGPTYPDHYKPVLVAMNGIVQHIIYQIEEGDNGDYWQPVGNEDAEGAPITQFQHWKSLPAAPVNPVEGGE